jgi:hypothetical protein
LIRENIRFRKSVKENVYTIQAQVKGQWLTIGLLFDNEKERDIELSKLRKGARFGKLKIEGRNIFSIQGSKVISMQLQGETCEK